LTSIPYLNQLPQTKGINWKQVLFWGFILGLIFLAVIYRDQLVNTVSGFISNIKLPSFDGAISVITEYVNKNPITVVISVIGAISGGLALYERIQKVRADSATAYAQSQKQQMEAQFTDELNKQQSHINDLKSQLKTQANDTSGEMLQEAQSTVSRQAETIRSQERQIHELMDKLANTPVKVVKVRD
jgi:hypothetical protein